MLSSCEDSADSEWRPVPPMFANGVDNIYASRDGRIRLGGAADARELLPSVGSQGKHGRYAILTLNNRSAYVHRLVFYAHSTLPLDTLSHGRVLFKEDALVRPDGVYRSAYDDLLFEVFQGCEDCGTLTRPLSPVAEPAEANDGEEWRPVPLNNFTREQYRISNRGRLQKHSGITTGWPVRTYRQVELCVSPTDKKKFYMHKLVYMAFHVDATLEAQVSHVPSAPLLTDGTYRNHAEDVCETTHVERARLAHADKRARMATFEKIEMSEREE